MSFKRQADTELNQDNVHDMDKEVSDKAKHDTWKKASDDVLATRKILKVSDGFSTNANKPKVETAAGGGGFAAYAKINPFAAMGPPMGFNTSASKTSATPNSALPNINTKNAPQLAPVVSNSPKTNPFGASNPAHNPFMNFVGDNKPNVDYWQKFKEPVKVPASEPVSSSDVKVTFVNPSSNKQQESNASAFTTTTSVQKSKIISSASTIGSISSSNSSASSDTGDISSASTSQDSSIPDTSTQSTEDNDDDEGSDEADDTASTSLLGEKKPSIDTAAMFHKPTELDNGEAGEECVLKLRAKLYRLSEVCGEGGSSSTAAAAAKEWVEVGTGPVRLLTPSACSTSADVAVSEVQAALFPRIVMRREHQAGGPGTKVILNASFRSHFSVAKMGERAARLTCLSVPLESPKSISPVSGGEVLDAATVTATPPVEEVHSEATASPMTFLFKMQHSHEADQFIRHISGFLEKSKASEEKKD